MIKNILLIVSLAVILTTINVFACDIDGKTGYLPENDLHISVHAKVQNNMTEERFNEIIDLADKHYDPIVKAKGGKLKWARLWSNGTVNASAQRQGKTYKVNMYGGLARHELVTEDGFALVVCHELGHHLGGAPKVARLYSKWASNEGQSDYFASLKCFRRIFESEDNEKIIAGMQVPAIVTQKCSANFTLPNDVALCVRASMAGKSLADLLSSLRNSGPTDFTTPDTNEVSRTNNAHPAGQCRLDTYFQGAICEIDYNEEVSDKDANVATCHRKGNFKDGLRPLCWYAPKK